MRLFRYDNGDISVHHSRDEHPDGASFVMHAHTGCEVYLFLEGKGYYIVEGNHYALAPGTVMLMREGEVHMLHISPEQPYERIAVHFPLRMLWEEPAVLTGLFTDHPLGKENGYPPLSGDGYIADSLRHLCRVSAFPLTPDEMDRRIRAYLIPVLFELAGRREHAVSVVPKESGTAADPTASSLIAYINEHLTEKMSMDFLAKRTFFSVSHMNKVFRAATGSSVWDYIVVKRLLLARSLIRDGKPATYAAARAGFSDYSSFYRQYRKRFGVSPAADRKK